MKKRRKIESAGWPAAAVVVELPDGSMLVRQVASHSAQLRCLWADGESVVQGTFTFHEGEPANAGGDDAPMHKRPLRTSRKAKGQRR